MYAVIKTGGKQYKVREGDTLKIEKIDANTGDDIDFNEVLLIGHGEDIQVGTPMLAGRKVTATVQAQGRSKKIKIIKFRRRKHYRKQMGHRQYFTEVKINQIVAN
jgi:large subunit ribosomal protein L21